MGPLAIAAVLSVAPKAIQEVHGLFAKSINPTLPTNNREIAENLCKRSD